MLFFCIVPAYSYLCALKHYSHKMKRIISLLTLYIYIGAVALAQFQNPVTFTVTQKQAGDNALEVIFQRTIDAGWHVYGTDIADGGPTRAELTLVPSQAPIPTTRT